jgi:hypothetical protein
MNANNNNSQIDFGLLPKNIPSLCIPRVFPNISESRIRKTFEDIFIGRIEKIDIIKGDKFNRVFVHLIWNNTSDALYVRNQVMTGKDVKVVYDGPWFWMVSASRNQTQPPPQPQRLFRKTDEFGRELRTTMQEPLIKPILQMQYTCFQPPLPPTPPPMQMQMQDHRPPESNYHHYQHRNKQPMKRDNHQQQQQLTDEFGRDIRRQAPPPVRRPVRVPVKQDNKSWSSYDDEIDTDDEEELIKPVFIPQSPTTTPPSLRHKQLKEDQEEKEEKEPTTTKNNTRFTDVDQPKPAELIQVKYDVVLQLNKIRGNSINKKSNK